APNGQWHSLAARMAILLPVRRGGTLPAMTFTLRTRRPQPLTVTLLGSEKSGNFTPECCYAGVTLDVGQEGDYTCTFDWQSDRDQYVFVAFSASEEVEIALTDTHLPGLMTVFNSLNARVAKHTRQVADGDYGVDEFDFWLPRRRPHQVMPALQLDPPLRCFSPDNLLNGRLRPEQYSNAWVPDAQDAAPQVTWQWPAPHAFRHLTLVQDHDFDNAM